MSMETWLTSGTSEAPQESPRREADELDWDKLLEISPSSLHTWKKKQLQGLFDTFVQVTGLPHSRG